MIRNFLVASVTLAGLAAPALADQVLTATGRGELYLVNPDTRDSQYMASTTQLFDIAETSDGLLYGVTGEGILVQIDLGTGKTRQIGRTGTFVNALVGAPDGRLIGAGDNKIYEIDRKAGRARRLMSLTDFASSGDLAYGPDGALYATGLPSGGSDGDILVRLDLEHGTGQQVGQGLGLPNVYCLAAVRGGLLGITESNEMLFIDVNTGSAKSLGLAGRHASCFGATTLIKSHAVGS